MSDTVMFILLCAGFLIVFLAGLVIGSNSSWYEGYKDGRKDGRASAEYELRILANRELTE